MNKFDSTLLPQTNDKEEIQKGNLDLLAKINATILFMQEGIVTFAQEILKVLSTYIFPASRVSFAPGNSGLSATEVQTMGTELANPINVKASIVDADTVTGNDSADGGKVKKWTWATVKAFLAVIFAPKAGGATTGKIQNVNVDLDTFDCYSNGTGTAGAVGEVWFYSFMRVIDSTGIIDFYASGTGLGNAIIISGSAGKTVKGFAWRQT